MPGVRHGFGNAATLHLICVFAGCAADVGSASTPVIYGEDARLEVHEHADSMLVDLAQNAVGAVVDRRLVDTTTQPATLRTLTLSDHLVSEFELPLCEMERFADQPVLASCSGVLIDDDLFVTASHCLPTQRFCDDLRVVFDYFYASDSRLENIGVDDVYACESIVVISHLRDYAIIRLDRPVAEPRAPAQVRSGGQELAPGDRVNILGFPSGLPLKIDDTGVVNRAEPTESFSFFADVAEGSSGSPVFDNRGQLVGVVSEGSEPDWDQRRDCVRPETADDGEGDGVKAGYIFRALHELCDGGPGSARLCGDSDAWCPNCTSSSGCQAAPDASSWVFALLLLRMRLRRRFGEPPPPGTRSRPRSGQAVREVLSPGRVSRFLCRR